MKNTIFKTLGIILITVLCLSGCGNEKATSSTTEDNNIVADLPNADFNVKVSVGKQVTNAKTTITLKESTTEINGDGAKVDGTDIVITNGGNYVISGTLKNGRIIVSAGNSNVNVILNGADITSNYSSAFFVQKAGEVTLTANEGSVNILKDAANYDFSDKYSNSDKSEPDACLYSEDDLIINGEGELLVKGNFKNGVTGKTVLNIEKIKLTVSSSEHGITGKEELLLKDASFNVISGGDGLRANSTANPSLGTVTLINSMGSIVSDEDGVQAETTLTLESGNYTVTSGGGYKTEPSSAISTKALKGGNKIIINGGTITADSSDDALHSNGNIDIKGGNFNLKSGDDAIHSDDDLNISGGTIIADVCYEGLEATNVTVSGGDIKIISSDDGVNISGGDGSSDLGGRGKDLFGSSGGKLLVSGGKVVVNAEGDGLDANGDVEISGGTVIVNGPTRGGNGVMDYDGEFLVNGGELIAVGTLDMAQNPSDNSKQNSLVFAGFSGGENEIFAILSSDGTEVSSYISLKSFNWVCYSSPKIKKGESYTAYVGGSHSGTSNDGVYSGGKYSKGTEVAEFTVENTVTSNGFSAGMGMGGNRGPMQGGRPSGNKGNLPFGFERE